MAKQGQFDKMGDLDFYFLASENVYPSQGILLSLRFTTNQSPIQIRDAWLHILNLYPRMRTIVEPSFFSYRFKVLEDERILAILFRDAFRIVNGIRCDSEEFMENRRNLYNEPFSLEQGLPWKARYFPDDPQPVLLVSIHHAIGDARSIFHMVDAFLAYLNGKETQPIKLDDPSMAPFFLEKPFFKFLLQLLRNIRIYYNALKQPKPGLIAQSSSHPVRFLGPADVYMHTLAYDLPTLKNKARAFGTTLNVFLLTALTMALAQRPDIEGDVIGIRVPIDLRPFAPDPKPIFGNYGIVPMIFIPRDLWNKPEAIMQTAKDQMQAFLSNIQNKNLLLDYWLGASMKILGRKFLSRIISISREKGLGTKTATLANIGNLDYLNAHGSTAQICEAIATFIQYGLFIDIVTINNRLLFAFTYQEAEFTRQEVDIFISTFERSIEELIAV